MNIKWQINRALRFLIGVRNWKEVIYVLQNVNKNNVLKKLNSIGPGMCLAKWKQVTLHLGTGHTHSCHHPKTHKIPLDEIAVDPSALHNTSIKKCARQEMLTGGRPSECHYCWNVEDSAPEQVIVFSDRTLKSSEPWALPHFSEVMDAGAEKNINPSYLEVSFSNVCNFKCSYCNPEVSSKWMEEIKQQGPYPTSLNYNNLDWVKMQDKMPIPEKDDNPYTDAFWKWWPDLYPSLYTFRITGGEPLLSKHTFKVLDYIIANPNPKIELAINSNCVVPDALFDEFIAKIKIIEDTRAVRSFTLYTSCEAHGAKAEYIRHGLDYNKWLENCVKLLKEIPTAYFCIMSTYNAFSVTSYTDFLQDVLNLKRTFNNDQRIVMIDIPYLNYPNWMNVGILPTTYRNEIQKQLEFMKANSKDGFIPDEVNKLDRIQYLFNDKTDPILLKDFVAFCDEHDRRRGTNFAETFPEMMDFYNECKKLTLEI